MTAPRVVMVVPCYLEAERLKPAAFLQFLPSRPWLTFLFVDDGSGDRTGEVLASIQSACPAQVRVHRLAAHFGKDEAVRVGLLEAARSAPDYVGFWDADLATPLDAIDDFVALARRRPEVDLLIGARVNLMGRVIRRRALRHYVSRVFATAASLALDLPIYDTQCGAKLFRASGEVLAAFAARFHSRWIFDVEILERYLALPVGDGGPPRRARIHEVVLREWSEVPGSKLRTRDFLWSFVEVLGVWRRRLARRASGTSFTAAGEQRDTKGGTPKGASRALLLL